MTTRGEMIKQIMENRVLDVGAALRWIVADDAAHGLTPEMVGAFVADAQGYIANRDFLIFKPVFWGKLKFSPPPH